MAGVINAAFPEIFQKYPEVSKRYLIGYLLSNLNKTISVLRAKERIHAMNAVIMSQVS